MKLDEEIILQADQARYCQMLNQFRVAVPIFHAYAHEAACQHRYSPRNKTGFGMVDGENVERLWSFLGRFSKMTKEMSPANRIDVLNDALTHYCSLKESKLGMIQLLASIHSQ